VISSEDGLDELTRASGLDLAEYRAAHVEERVRRACDAERVDGSRALARLLRADEAARGRFRRAVAVSHTGFFRDAEQFVVIERELLPRLAERARRLRCWSAGCADGSELYSLAVVLQRASLLESSFLLGSDLLEENVSAARRGPTFPEITAGMRAKVRFERRDLLRDGAPPGRFSLVICRNVAIYLAPDAKRRLHSLLAGSLAPGGALVVGRSERIGYAGTLGLAQAGPHVYLRP
jgi:chemotaxis protein methyltransferase CheR